MEEADLLRERLQAITDKRRVQEDIAKKRSEIEGVKLKLQYLKKKALREQWLMDGLSGQNEQEEEAMRAQVQEEQQQTELLQNQLQSIESEIEALETQEMNILVNEELILKRLKEVEKTAEDIIKEVNGDFQTEPIQYIYSAIPDMPKSYTPTLLRRINTLLQDSISVPEKKAMYAVEISVEKDLRTGESHVLSSATVTPQEFHQRGIKVYDDGIKSVFAVQSAGKESEKTIDELSPLEVEELLQKATEKKVPCDVEYHEPVYSIPYSRSSTPNKGERGMVSLAPSGFHIPSETLSPIWNDITQSQANTEGLLSCILESITKQNLHNTNLAYPNTINVQKSKLTTGCDYMHSNKTGSLQELEEQKSLSPVKERSSTMNPNKNSSFHIADSFPPELDSTNPVTMIFMGYQNAETNEGDEAIQAELVLISDDEEENDEEQMLSYHPEGYHSKIFHPKNYNSHRSEWCSRDKALSYWLLLAHSVRGAVSVATGKSISLALSTLLLPQSKEAATEYPEVDGTEVSEDCFPIQNQTQTELKAKTVTMETSEQCGTGNNSDYEMQAEDAVLPENTDTCANDEQACNDDDLLESLSAKVAFAILADLPATETNTDEEEKMSSPKEALVLEDTRDELNHNESINSSVSDTPSSAANVCENGAIQKRQDSVKEESPKNTVSVIANTEDGDVLDPLKTELHHTILEGLDYGEVEESMLESYIRDEIMSDISNESIHNPDDLEECLLVEIAAASSDSETDEKWRTIFSSSINKEDDDSYLDSLQLSAQELFIQKPEVKPIESQADEEQHFPAEEEVLEQPECTTVYGQPTKEISYNPSPLFHALSKISEDEEELGKSLVNHKDTSSSCVKSDSKKKLPKDYCVIQEMKSEHVSTEHVDFKVARNQWLQMEEQTKNLSHQPTLRTGTCQGSHNVMYTPVRNIERNKREPDLESLALGKDYPHTQFSPCSEDSGVYDSSYRSPYDDPGTPIEKDIRFAIEHDEKLRRDRGMTKSYSSDCVPGKGKPVILNTGNLHQEVDEKRKMLEHLENDCRLSPSTTMPSFIITSSPTRSQRHEMAANNVIILEPESCHQSPRHGGKLVTSKSADWRSEDTPNLIILETSNLIIRSASEFNLNSAVETEEKTFLNNPFFKLKSRSTLSLVDEEIKMAKQREEELKKQRANIYSRDNFLASPTLLNSSYDKQDDFPIKCKSSPSSPMKTCKMDRSALSCDHRFPESYSGGRRKSAMALRWEAGEFANN